MRRREFITLLGGAAAVWSAGAHGQQSAMPAIGWLESGSRQSIADYLAAFRQGLAEANYVEGRNVAIEFRWAEASHYRDLIVALAARHRLPAIYASRYFVTDGGLISYGPDLIDQYRRAAVYVDRILKGEKPADLPVQAPTKYELVINLKTANGLGLAIPDKLLALADEAIE
jgi:hypothetical protein